MVHLRVIPRAKTPLQLSVVWSIRRAFETHVAVVSVVQLRGCDECLWLIIERLSIERSAKFDLSLGVIDHVSTTLDSLSVFLGRVCEILYAGVSEASVRPRLDFEVEGVAIDIRRKAFQRQIVLTRPVELLDPDADLGWGAETLTEKDMLAVVVVFRLTRSIGVDHTCLQMEIARKCHPTAADLETPASVPGCCLNTKSVSIDFWEGQGQGARPERFRVGKTHPDEKLRWCGITVGEFD